MPPIRTTRDGQECPSYDEPFGSATAGAELVAAPAVDGIVIGDLGVQFAEGDITGEGFPGAIVTIEL